MSAGAPDGRAKFTPPTRALDGLLWKGPVERVGRIYKLGEEPSMVDE